MTDGGLALILHAHLPFVRHPESDDSLEESWLHEALTGTYLPLLFMLERLAADGIDFRLTLSLTPTLTAMLADPLLQYRYCRRLEWQLLLAEKELRRTAGQKEYRHLAERYRQHLFRIREAFLGRYERNLLHSFQLVRESGRLEIIASAATHGYLPLLAVNESAVRAQIRVGIERYRALFAASPRGFWLPECAYYPGVDRLLAAEGIEYTVVETSAITRAQPRPVSGVYLPVRAPAGLLVYGRDPDSSRQVWSASEGYPGHGQYREFYRDIAYDLHPEELRPCLLVDGLRFDTGFKYYRITGSGPGKEVYRPEQADAVVAAQVENFFRAKQSQLAALAASGLPAAPVIVAPFDAELFGHWWHEGVGWLEGVIRRCAVPGDGLRLLTLAEHGAENLGQQRAEPAASSWGREGCHQTWLNAKNDWIYPLLHRAAGEMAALVAAYPGAAGWRRRALQQAGRELLLAQASDWAFMMDAGTMTGYARRRTEEHLDNFHRLQAGIRRGKLDLLWLAGLESRDNLFPELDPEVFAA